jgi:hypothetical protein
MKAEELRIGNCVNYFNDGEHSLIRILDWGYAHLNDASSIEYELLKPIPLTEEWLLKFGFEIGWIISHKETYFNLNKNGKDYFYSPDQHHNSSEAIQNVHQLQNLYYALTNKELNYEG